MPMIPQTAFAMLACARIGVIHSVVLEVLHHMNWLSELMIVNQEQSLPLHQELN
jgi:acyl-coenzyme A synthetase/AMP-(fatty) acid ligase